MNPTPHYCLDTDMCIYLLNGHPRVKARVAEVGITGLAVAIPTVGELYFGAYNSERVEANIARVRPFSLRLDRRCCLSMSSPQSSLADSRPSYAVRADRLATLISSSLVWPCAMD